jgi:hypothetical protein
LLQVARWWHYEATQMLQGLKLFWSSTDAHPFPRMLVLDPAILVQASSRDELLALHHGIILAGYLSQRVWHWPLLDCSSKRIGQSTSPRHWHGVFDNTVLPYGGLGNVKCIDLDLTWNVCMEVRAAKNNCERHVGHGLATIHRSEAHQAVLECLCLSIASCTQSVSI